MPEKEHLYIPCTNLNVKALSWNKEIASHPVSLYANYMLRKWWSNKGSILSLKPSMSDNREPSASAFSPSTAINHGLYCFSPWNSHHCENKDELKISAIMEIPRDSGKSSLFWIIHLFQKIIGIYITNQLIPFLSPITITINTKISI